MARTYIPTTTVDPRQHVVDRWMESQKLAQSIIKAALKEPTRMKTGVLKELLGMLTHGLQALKIMELMQAEKPEVDFHLQLRRADLLKLYRGMAKLSKHLITNIMADPLEIKPTELAGVNGMLSKSTQMVSVLESLQREHQKEQELEETGGLTDEELDIMADFEEMEKGLNRAGKEGGEQANGLQQEETPWRIN